MDKCSRYCFVEQDGLGGPTNCMLEQAVPQIVKWSKLSNKLYSSVSWLTNECNTPPNDAFSPVRWGVGTRPGHRFVPMAKKIDCNRFFLLSIGKSKENALYMVIQTYIFIDFRSAHLPILVTRNIFLKTIVESISTTYSHPIYYFPI